MKGEDRRLLRVAGQVSDGDPLDWDDVESQSNDERELRLLRRLRLVSSIAASNRRGRLRDGPATSEETDAPGVERPVSPRARRAGRLRTEKK